MVFNNGLKNMGELGSSDGKCEGYGLEYDVLQTGRGSPMLGRTLQPPPFTMGMEVTGLSETWLNCFRPQGITFKKSVICSLIFFLTHATN